MDLHTSAHFRIGLAVLLLSPSCGTVVTLEETTSTNSSSTSTGELGGSEDPAPSSSGPGTTTAAGTNGSSSTGTEPTCGDGERNGTETDIDCGNECGSNCELGEGCDDVDDCVTGLCDSDRLRCVAPFVCPNDENWDHLLPQDRQRANPDDHANDAPVVAVDGDGRYAVAWTATSQGASAVHMQQYEPSGRPLGSTLRLSDLSHHVSHPPVLATNTTGELVVTYYVSSGDFLGAYIRKFDATGAEALPPTLVNPPDHFLGLRAPEVAISDDGSFVAAWTPTQGAAESVWIQPFSSEGSPTVPPIQVSPPEQTVLARPNVDIAADGTILAAWVVEEEQACFARRVDGDGQPLEETWRVTPEGEETTSPCDVAMGPAGRFALTWVRRDPREGVLQSYGPTGELLGSAEVDTAGEILTVGSLPPVALDINADGNIVVSYTLDNVHTGWVRTFDASAEPLMDPVLVTDGHVLLTTPHVAAASCADALVVAWMRSSGGPVFSRLFVADDNDDGVPDLCCE